ncbi:MAG TPA: zinc metalloprotease HtpX [Bacillota bacterium]|nr:zinc metalloprotease HtpX [Bacillota bacterium]
MLYKQIQDNKRKTILLVTLFVSLTLAIGWAVGYAFSESSISGMVITAIILVVYIPMTYMSASSQVLKMSGAKEADRNEHAQLYAIVEELSLVSRVPMPKVYIIDDPALNAFATGIKPEKGAVAFTTGLLETLNREELSGVVAHELAHIRNYDIRLMTICIALVGVIILIADVGTRFFFFGGNRRGGGGKRGGNPIIMIVAILLIILAPMAAQFTRLAVSRNREYLADATAVEFTRNPEGLVRALRKISGDTRDVKKAQESTASMYISRPLKKKKKNRNNMWSTHPPIEDRIKRLQEM